MMAALEKDVSFVAVAVVLFLLVGNTIGLEGDYCSTPNEERGKCIEVKQCAPIIEKLTQKPLQLLTIAFLHRSQCGFKGKEPLVCCAIDSSPSKPPITPERPSKNPAQETPSSNNKDMIKDVTGHPNIALLRNDICGTLTDNRIFGGNRTALNELPWMALVAYSPRGSNPFRCGGTVINENYVLTAAHCVKFLPGNLHPVSVRLGEHDLSSDIDCELDPITKTTICAPPPQDIPIAEIIPHPEYIGKKDLQHDLALLRLKRPADFTPESVRPVCLPIGLDQQAQDFTGRKVIVSGWGTTENQTSSKVLLKVALPVVSNTQCSSSYKTQVQQISATTQICAGGTTIGQDSCTGDSGGPLTFFGLVDNNPRTVQFGIVSFGPKRCGTGLPGVYTRVGYFMDWILNNLKK